MQARPESSARGRVRRHEALPVTSLEHLLGANIALHLIQNPSRTSSSAQIRLPESRDSSIVPNGSTSRDGTLGLPTLGSQEAVHLSSDIPRSDVEPRVRFERNTDAGAIEANLRNNSAYVEDEEPEPSPLWYKSHTFPHRYGSSTHKEGLLEPPKRSHTLPVKLPSGENGTKIYDSGPLMQGPSLPGPSNTLTSSMEQGANGIRPRAVTESVEEGEGGVETAQFDGEGPSSARNRTNNAETGEHDTPRSNPGSARPSSRDRHRHRQGQRRGRANTQAPLVANAGAQSPARGPEEGYAWIRRRRTAGPEGDTTERRRAVVSRRNRRQDRSSSPPNIRIHDYSQLVENLAAHMPQLSNVRGRDCRQPNSGNIYCYDSLISGGLPVSFDSIYFSRERRDTLRLATRIRDLKTDLAQDVRFRYILIEDLSPRVIDHIGSTFWLNPEFFEEHLNRSGYRPESYSDATPSTWNTNATPKTYVSVRWFRPVKRARIKPLSELERDVLLMKNEQDGKLTWYDTAPDGRYMNSVSLTTNIFRSEWAIVSNPEQTVLEDDGSTFPVAWEERATIQVSQIPGKPPIFMILLDPLPAVDLAIVPQNNKNPVARSKIVPFLQAYSRAPMGPKLGLIDVFDGKPLDEQTIRMLGSNLASANSTYTDLTSWLESTHGVQPDNADMNLLTGLLWIIHRDVLGFLYFVNTVLEEIGLNATDDYIIQKRLTHWRNLITRFQTELPAIRLSVKKFLEFLSQFQALDQARDFISATLERIDEVIIQNEKSYAALRADMALLESKRAIDQAESVGKLTELGFIFIPISCIAALFSMQIKPLSEPAPLYSFVVASVLVISFIFGVRLAIRSSALIEYKRETSRRIRLYTKLPPGAPIPTRTFIYYMLRDHRLYLTFLTPLWGPLGGFILAILAITAGMLPIIFLWMRNKGMDLSYKSTLTVVLFLMVAGIVFPFTKEWLASFFSGITYTEEGNTLRNIRNRLFHSGPYANQSAGNSRTDSTGSHVRPARKRDFFTNIAKRLMGRRRKKSDAEDAEIRSDDYVEYSENTRPSDRRRHSGSAMSRSHRAIYSENNIGNDSGVNRWRNDVAVAEDDVVENIDDVISFEELAERSVEADLEPATIPLPPSSDTLGSRPGF